MTRRAVRLDSAEFVIDGLVMRGTIDLSPRRGVVVKQEKTAAGDAHSRTRELDSRRPDRPAGVVVELVRDRETPGQATYQDRFLLRRPWGKVGRWGMAVGLKTPLPGLDGWGRVCLRITGVRVDPVTGQFETVMSTRRCTRFGFTIAGTGDQGGAPLSARHARAVAGCALSPAQGSAAGFAEAGRSDGGAANTLLIHV